MTDEQNYVTNALISTQDRRHSMDQTGMDQTDWLAWTKLGSKSSEGRFQKVTWNLETVEKQLGLLVSAVQKKSRFGTGEIIEHRSAGLEARLDYTIETMNERQQ